VAAAVAVAIARAVVAAVVAAAADVGMWSYAGGGPIAW